MDKFVNRYSVVRDGVKYEVELVIDIAAVAYEMVNNAARNSSGVSAAMYGAIKATVVSKS
jgi:hypothetical protein